MKWAWAGLAIVVMAGGCHSEQPPAATSTPLPTPAELVDPMLGTAWGNVFAGVSMPFGMVRLGPTTAGFNVTNGYRYSKPIVGFSHTHTSGTGGGPRYGNLLVTPTTGAPTLDRAADGRVNEYARLGYYQVQLARGADTVAVRLTSTRRVGMHEYLFGGSARDQDGWANLLFDPSHGLTRQRPNQHRCTGGDYTVLSDSTLTGWASFVDGWGAAAPYTVYYHAEVDRPWDQVARWEEQQWMGTGISRPQPPVDQRADSLNFGLALRWRQLPDDPVRLKVAISFVSQEQARANMAKELPHWSFDSVRQAQLDAWNPLLSRLSVEGGSLEQRILFYSLLRNTFLMPTDVTGEHPKWTPQGRAFWEFYCIWDTFRTVMPLHSLIAQDTQEAMLAYLMEVYRQGGWLPDAWIAGHYAAQQGGSNADVVFADAVVKGLGGFDPSLAYEAMKKNVEQEPADPRTRGRYLGDYLDYGYVLPSTTKGAISRTLEYAYNDFCLAQVASHLGKEQEAAVHMDRAKAVMQLFAQQHGYFWGKDSLGNWLPGFEKHPDRPDPWNDPLFYEGGTQIYTHYVPHLMASLIEAAGGAEAYEAMLDEVFDQGYRLGNEPAFAMPYLYNYLNKPSKTAERVQAVLRRQFRLGELALPGQDDSGATSAWFVWGAMGIYPIAGQAIYLIGSPLFEKSTMRLAEGSFTIAAPGASAERIYVVGASLDGKPLDRPYVTHQELTAGGELRLTMAATPDDSWCTQPPPSY